MNNADEIAAAGAEDYASNVHNVGVLTQNAANDHGVISGNTAGGTGAATSNQQSVLMKIIKLLQHLKNKQTSSSITNVNSK